MCLGVAIFGLIQFGTVCFLELDVCFFFQVREVFSYYAFTYVFCPSHKATFNNLMPFCVYEPLTLSFPWNTLSGFPKSVTPELQF